MTIASMTGRAPRFTALPPLSLYVHLPWCVRKCPYCDFNSHEARGEVPEGAYVDTLLADLESALPQVWGRRVGTVFIGYADAKGTRSIKLMLPGDRELIRWRASQAAMDYLRRQMMRPERASA